HDLLPPGKRPPDRPFIYDTELAPSYTMSYFILENVNWHIYEIKKPFPLEERVGCVCLSLLSLKE
ncbi:hypothetical protein MOD11_20520, partial [Bacillus atrophaeus]|uniref:hypothetical protein n=1 Tax=Bacillus atrophaeus TaxID=1452 RepID=UPI0022821A22